MKHHMQVEVEAQHAAALPFENCSFLDHHFPSNFAARFLGSSDVRIEEAPAALTSTCCLLITNVIVIQPYWYWHMHRGPSGRGCQTTTRQNVRSRKNWCAGLTSTTWMKCGGERAPSTSTAIRQ